MSNKKRIQKILSKKCPECGARLTVIEETEIVDGISYSIPMIECFNCGYGDLYKNNKKNRVKYS